MPPQSNLGRLFRRRQPSSAMIAPPGQLAPQRPRSSFVSMPRALPHNMQFGSTPRGPVQSSRYTGGVVQSPFAAKPLAPPPDFQAPQYAPLSPMGVRPLAPPSFQQTLRLVSSASSPTSTPPPTPPPPAPSSTYGPYTGTTYPPGWWNPETTPLPPWSQPGDTPPSSTGPSNDPGLTRYKPMFVRPGTRQI